MLTGDKGGTAKEIGISCGLVTPHIGHADHDNEKEGNDCATFEFKEFYNEATELFEEIKRFNEESGKYKKFEVLISGIAIQIAFDNAYMHPELQKLLIAANSVVVFRSSPG